MTGEHASELWSNLPNMRRAYASCRFGQLHYRVVSPPKPLFAPLLMFHQTPTSGRCYEGLVAEMGRDRITIAVGTLGLGSSDPPPHAPTIADYAGAMHDLLDVLEFDSLDLLGDHTGSKVAVSLALRDPARVRRVVLNGAPVYSDAKLKALREKDHDVETIGATGEHILARWRWAMSQRQASTALGAVLLEVAESLRAGSNVWHVHHTAFGFQHRDNLLNVHQRLFILWARDDLWGPTGRAKPLIRNGRMIDLPE